MLWFLHGKKATAEVVRFDRASVAEGSKNNSHILPFQVYYNSVSCVPQHESIKRSKSVFVVLRGMAPTPQFWERLITLILTWVLQAGTHDVEIPDKLDILESSRECFRTILSVCGVHRGTEVMAEAWQCLTLFKVHGVNEEELRSAALPPISSAAPSLHYQPLRSLGNVGHASILEEECCSSLDLLAALSSVNMENAEMERDTELEQWLQDLQFVVEAAHFSLLRR